MSILDEARKWQEKNTKSAEKKFGGDILSDARRWGVRNGKIDLESIYNDIYERTQKWLRGNETFANNYNAIYANEKQQYVPDSLKIYEDAESKVNKHNASADDILSYLADYEEFFDAKAVAAIREAISNGRKNNSEVVSYYKDAYENHSKYDSDYAFTNAINSGDFDAAQTYLNDMYKDVSNLGGEDPAYIEQRTSKLKEYQDYFTQMKEYSDAEAQAKEYLEYDAAAGQAEIERMENAPYYVAWKEAFENVEDVKAQILFLEREIDREKNAYRKNELAKELEDLRQKMVRYESIMVEFDGAKYAEDLAAKKAYHDEAVGYQTENEKYQEWYGVMLPNTESYDVDFDKKSSYGAFFSDPQETEDSRLLYLYINNRDDYLDYVEQVGENVTPGAPRITFNEHTASRADAMSEDEKKLFNYYYNTQGAQKAMQFFDSLEEHLNYKVGEKIAADLEKYPVLQYLYSGVVGFDNFVQGMENIMTDEVRPTSALQYAGAAVREDLAEDNPQYYNIKTGQWEDVGIWYNFKTGKWENKVFGSSVGQVAFDLGSTISNQLPSIIVSAAIGTVSKTAGAAVGATLLGASAGGNAKQEMLKLGYSKDQANAYGLLVGASEAGLSYVLGGIPGLRGSDGVFSALGQKVLTKVDNALARAAITLGANMLDEGLEEGLQTVLEPWFKSVVTNADYEAPNIDEVLYSSLLGALSAAGFGAGEAVGVYQDAKQKYVSVKPNSDILSMIDNVSKGNFKPNDKVYLNNVSDDIAKQIYDLTGVDVKGFKVAIEARQIEHILKDHGKNGRSDRSMANPEDIAKIEHVLNSPDKLSKAGKTQAYSYMRDGKNRTADTVLYEKNIGEQSHYVVQAIPDTKAKTLYVVTTFIGKSGYEKGASQLINAQSPNATSEIGSANTPNGSISHDGGFVNSKNLTYLAQSAELADIGESGVQIMREIYDGSTDPVKFFEAYNRVYAAGKRSGQTRGRDVSLLGKNVSDMIYKAGQMDALKNGGTTVATVNTTTLKAELKRRENSQQSLQNGSQSGTISTENMEAQNEQELHLRDSGERNDSKNSRGQVSAVEGNARQNKGRGEGRTESRDSEASSLSYDREVSAKSLVKGGLESSKVRIVAEGSETESMKEARKIAESRGLKVVFFGGGNLKVLEGSKIISARAYIQGDTVYVRVDHAGFAADQLMLHEAAHDMIDKGEINVEDVKKLISERFTPEEIDAVINSYAIAYEGAGMTADEIWEEVICDSVAEMNSFEGTDFTAAAEMAADFLPDLKEAVLESKKESRGPPKNVEGKASIEMDVESTDYKINTSMTMAEAKRMIETAYKVNGIAEYYEGEYRDAEDWLKKAGSSEVEMYIENDYDLQAKYINSNDDILNEEYTIRDVLEAYLAGTLVGKEKPKPKRLDVSQSTKLQDDRFYSPQKIEDAKALFDLANQKAVGKDAGAINRARAEILLFAHNKGAAELLGVTQAELNKKLRGWSGYSTTAKNISERINAGVAEENRWTGIENSAYINKAKVTNEDIERLVASVDGDSKGYERKYIARVMLAADTHIDYSGLKFKFASSQQVNADNRSGGRVLGFYDDTNRQIEVTHDKPHTVAHEMGHYIDAQWGRDLIGSSSSHLFLTTGVNSDMVRDRYGESGVQFLNNFKLFINSLSDVNQTYNSYYNDRKEIFARFFARFVEWTDNIATGNKYYSYESTMYGDKFTQTQYIEFARLLQEKALLDGMVSNSMEDLSEPRTPAESEIMRSIKYANGNAVVWIEDDVLKGNKLPVHQAVANYLVHHIGDVYTIIESGQKVYLGKNLPSEYTQSEYTKSLLKRPSILKAKNKALPNLGEMIEIATNRRWSKDKGSGKKDAKYGVYKYNTRFAFPIYDSRGNKVKARAYDATLIIINSSDGKKYLYDLTEIKENTSVSVNLSERGAMPAYAGQKESVSTISIPQKSDLSTPDAKKVSKDDGHASIDLNEMMGETEIETKTEARELSSREILADMLESVAETDRDKSILNRYKDHLSKIENNRAEIERLKDERKKVEKAKQKKAISQKIEKLQGEIDYSEKRLITLEDTTTLKYLVSKERKARQAEAHLAGQMAQGRRDAEILRHANEKLAEQKTAYGEKLAEQKKSAREALEEQAKRYQESRAKSVEGRRKTKMKENIRKVVKDINTLLKKNDKKNNVKQEQQTAVATSLALAEVLFNDNIRNEDIVRLGVDSVTTAESVLLNEYRDLLDDRDATIAKIDAIHSNGLAKENLIEQVEAIDKTLTKINNRISMLNSKLSDVFERERTRLNKSTINGVFDALITEYSKLANSEKQYIKNAYSEVVKTRLESLKMDLDGKTAKDMDIYQLTEVYDTFKAIKHMISTSNNIFREGRSEDLETYVSDTQKEIFESTTEPKDRGVFVNDISNVLSEFSWNNLRPVDAFERLGSKTFEKLFWDYVAGMGVAARDVVEARDVIANAREKYGYSKWNLKIADATYTTRDGLKFKPTLADKLSIYAYSKREKADGTKQAMGHMVEGGFTYDTGETYKDVEAGKTYVRRKLSTTYRLSEGNIKSIINSLTQEQRAYVDAILPYLTDMGKKGNEVSMTLYGIELFGDKIYFPLQSSSDYLNSTTQELGTTKTMSSLANSGFTKQTNPNADNPIVLRGFDDVVLEHIEKMSNYHGLVIPIENLRRVFDNVSRDADRNSLSTKALIGSRYGTAAQKYFAQMLTDFNGGISPSGAKSLFSKLFSRGKAMAVSANLSVVAQQYFSIIRAMEIVNPKYFMPFLNSEARKSDMKQYEELLQHVPVAIIKEMNGFDVGSSGRVKDYIGYEGVRKDAKYVRKTIDDVAMWGAGQMDKFGWVTIWKAIKAEVASEQKLTPGTKAFFDACEKRATEVITRTQVYDSIASRSGYMRSSSDAVKYATSFMGEPTVIMGRYFVNTVNLVRAVKSKNKGKMNKAFTGWVRAAAVMTVSQVLSNLAKSLIYAGRDDEEDEAFLEKWMKNFAQALVSDLNPLNSLPFTRDIMSIIEGWDVERPDLTLIADAVTSVKKFNDGITIDEALGFIGALGNLVGIPFKNLIREVNSARNAFDDIVLDDINPTDVGGAFVEGITGKERTKQTNLYNAIISGDTGKIEAIKGTYKTKEAYESAVRSALRDNDPRIKEAAKALISGDIRVYNDIVNSIASEGYFEAEMVESAIRAEQSAFNTKVNKAAEAKNNGDETEYKKLVKELLESYEGVYSQDEIVGFIETAQSKQLEEGNNEDTEEATSIFKTTDVIMAFEFGDSEMAVAAIEDLFNTKVENYIAEARREAKEKGKKFDEAEAREEAEDEVRTTLRSTLTKHYKPLYYSAYLKGDSKEMERIRNILITSELYVYKTKKDVDDVLEEWIESYDED